MCGVCVSNLRPPPWPKPGSGHLSPGQLSGLLSGLPAATLIPTVHFYTAARAILLGHVVLSVQNRGVGKQVEAGVYIPLSAHAPG